MQAELQRLTRTIGAFGRKRRVDAVRPTICRDVNRYSRRNLPLSSSMAPALTGVERLRLSPPTRALGARRDHPFVNSTADREDALRASRGRRRTATPRMHRPAPARRETG